MLSVLSRSEYEHGAHKLVLVTGDGNSNYNRASFPEVVGKALEKGWKVEVWSWKAATAQVSQA